MKEKKISSNDFANMGLIISVLIMAFIVLLLVVGLDIYSAIIGEIIFAFKGYKVFQRINEDVYYDEEKLIIKDYKATYEIPLMRVRRIRLTTDHINSSKKYIIEYIDDANDFASVSLYVNSLNTEFHKFIDYIEESYQFIDTR